MTLISNKNKHDLVVLFHEIVNEPPQKWEDVSSKVFHKFLSALQARRGEVNSGVNCIFSFDDGRIADYENAFPLLKEFGFTAKFFVISDNVGKSGYMNWSHLKELQANGMTIGSHSCSHNDLSRMSLSDVENEMSVSKKILEDKLGQKINSFSFPYGGVNKRVIEIGKRSGYQRLYTTRRELSCSNDFCVGRYSMNHKMTADQMITLLGANIVQKLNWKLLDLIRLNMVNTLTPATYKRIRDLLN